MKKKNKNKYKKFKTIFWFIFLIILLFVFRNIILKNNRGSEVIKISDNTVSPENNDNTTSINEEPYIDDNPIILGIYNRNSSNTKRVLVSEVAKPWTYHNDIIEYNVFFTQDDEIDNTRIPICFDKYATRYVDDVSQYRIGYQVEFSTGQQTYKKTIISPKDTEDFFDYLEIYLYDGYHRAAGEWYSHTTEEEYNKDTLLLGIKLTSGKKVNEINSDIILTAFSYDSTNSEDFDSEGNYRGDSKYSITVKKSNK